MRLLICGIICLTKLTLGSPIAKEMAEVMKEVNIPGMALVVTQGNRIVAEEYQGYADLSQPKYVGAQSLFRIASISKIFVGISVMQLVERGVWNLDDDINNYAELPIRNPNYPDAVITLRMLMTHTSSINDGDILSKTQHEGGKSPLSLRDFLRGFFLPSGSWFSEKNFHESRPGTKYDYSNVAMAVLAHLVEAVTEMDYELYSKRSLFEPLEMFETSWHLEGVDEENVAIPYVWTPSGFAGFPHYSYPCYTSGGIRTSARQLSHLLHFLSTGRYKGRQLLSSANLERMKDVQYPELDPDQGLILYHKDLGSRRLLGHSGGNVGGRTWMFFDPTTDRGVIALMNGEPTTELPLRAFLSKLYD